MSTNTLSTERTPVEGVNTGRIWLAGLVGIAGAVKHFSGCYCSVYS